MIKTFFHYLLSFALLFSCYVMGLALQHILGSSIPGGIFGMLILFGLMLIGFIPSELIRPGATFTVKYMVILFIPISVGIIDHVDLLINNAFPIFASTVGGSFIILISLGYGLDRHLKKRKSSCG